MNIYIGNALEHSSYSEKSDFGGFTQYHEISTTQRRIKFGL
ncbi:hypothetical protein D515_01076 [Grimontia indica]|uniref:Uncharacterized protein n=1 Tax=Grimontia indica TaxID=1056512 RepID=R1GUX2_9GAMM|nr:hypothetical protein D515_01076 [Grimontia indica]